MAPHCKIHNGGRISHILKLIGEDVSHQDWGASHIVRIKKKLQNLWFLKRLLWKMAHLFPFIDYDCAGLAIKLGDMKNMLNHRLREGTLGSPKIIKIIPQSYFLSYGCIHRGMIAFPQEVPPKRHWQHLTCHENPSAQSCSNWQIFSEQIPWHYISCLMFLLKMRHTPQVFQHFGGKKHGD